MIGRTFSTTLVGIDAILVDVEAQITGALKRFTMVGLPDGVVRESRERVRCAIEQSGFSFPTGDVVISLSPAMLPKYGSGFDLAIAVSILAASGVIDPAVVAQHMFLGELALDGTLRPICGTLAAACLAERRGGGLAMIVPGANGPEASLVSGIEVRTAGTLAEVVGFLTGAGKLAAASPGAAAVQGDIQPDFDDVVGQFAAKRALEIAAAGGHSVLLVGVPGAGKSMVAARIMSLLPPLSLQEQIEVTKVYSAVGAIGSASAGNVTVPLVTSRPFRAPHHSLSTAGLVGGGPLPVPGEISLAHHGVLFLDEVTEMRREALESLRQPLESRTVTLSRAKLRVTFPADFIFLAAMNPCPCGKRGIEGGGCLCSNSAVAKYVSRISGPILDRIDLQVWVPPLPVRELTAVRGEDPTPAMRARVTLARTAQSARGALNARMQPADVRRFCALGSAPADLMERAAERFRFSARSYTRMLKTARTIADLEGSEEILSSHVAEVLQYRLPS